MEREVSENLSYLEGEILGRGPVSFVFAGFFGEEKIGVAVKRLRVEGVRSEAQMKREEAVLDLVHPNVARLYGIEEDDCFKYLILERCHGSLDQLFNQTIKTTPGQREGLLQLAEGLNYIHSKGLVYFDVKPSNVLISAGDPVHFKWADFGLQPVSNSKGSLFSSGVQESHWWLAPEIIGLLHDQKFVAKNKITDTPGRNEATVASDVFSLGIIYFSFVTRGLHMFGGKNLIVPNITCKRRVNLGKLNRDHFAYDIVDGMTRPRASDRISLDQVIELLS